ncbi:MAG: LPS export ABC transporter ATP-binding protein [Psittacicella sp.]
MSILKVNNLKKIYGKREVIRGVNLEIHSSEIIGLLGPNGAGKTTTFYMIVGLIKHNTGNIFIDELDISNKAIHARAKAGIGYLPQEASIFRKLSVYENILSIFQLDKNLTKTQQKEKANGLISEFKLDHIRNSLGFTLSGGERRRVEIARALASNPKFILLDEPFAGVDPISIRDIKNIILDLKNRGIGVLITDHNVRETLDVCERAYIVGNGTIIASGAPKEILENDIVKSTYLGHEFKL